MGYGFVHDLLLPSALLHPSPMGTTFLIIAHGGDPLARTGDVLALMS
jgi:hypothetical protein